MPDQLIAGMIDEQTISLGPNRNFTLLNDNKATKYAGTNVN